MHNICIPGTVGVLVRRLVHLVSTLSIAHQYHSIEGRKHDPVQTGDQREQIFGTVGTMLDEGHQSLSQMLSEQWTKMRSGYSWRSPVQQSQQLSQGIGIFFPWFGSIWRSFPDLRLLSTSSEHSVEHQSPSLESDSGGTFPPAQNPGSQQNNDKHSADDIIHTLMRNPALYDPLRSPRYPIVLCHGKVCFAVDPTSFSLGQGLYGFDVRGPSSLPFLQKHYWSNVLHVLRKKVGAEVIVTAVPSTGSIASRAERLHAFLQESVQDKGINFIGHSMGGLDCRHLISTIQPTDYTPLSLTTVGTPHRGSPFMDWCQDNIGLGRLHIKRGLDQTSNNVPEDVVVSTSSTQQSVASQTSKQSFTFSSLPSSFTTLLLSLLDSPAYGNLSTKYLNEEFNPATPDAPGVRYFSIAGRTNGVSIWHPLWLPKIVLDSFEYREKQRLSLHMNDQLWGNDCIVSIQSAMWGEFLGVLEGCDHWNMRGARGLDLNVDFSSVSMPSFARNLAKEGDSWSLRDWGRFVKLYRSEENKSFAPASMKSSHPPMPPVQTVENGDLDRENALKSSTDKVSAVLDWIVEQVPYASKRNGSASERERLKKRDLATKEGLERLYVALCRKLYDEGL